MTGLGIALGDADDQVSRKGFAKPLAMGVEYGVLHSRSMAFSLHLSSAQTLIYRKSNRNQKRRRAKGDATGSGQKE